MVTLLAFVFVLGLLIFVHELGHFLVAKWAGVRVEVFSLGFGPRLLSIVRGDTEYCVCAIPLGGYVKMTGQDDLPGDPQTRLSGADYEFPSKPWWQRLLIAGAGPAMNFVTAFAIFYGVYFFMGIPRQAEHDTTVELVSRGFPAEGVLQAGDKILTLDGKPVHTYLDMASVLKEGTADSIEIEVQRGGQTLKTRLGVKVDEHGKRRLGVVGELPVIGEVHRDQQLPPETRHLRPGDQVLGVNGQPIELWAQFEEVIQANLGKPLVLELLRREPFEVELLTASSGGDDLSAYGVQLGEGGRVSGVEAGSRGEEAGLRPGDVVLSRSVAPTPFFKKLFRKIRGEDVQETLVVRVRRDGPFELTVTPVENPITHKGLLGVEKRVEYIFDRFLPVESLRAATYKFLDSSLLVFVILHRLLTADIPASTLAGPVGIMQVTGKQAEKGLMDLLLLAAMLSVNLAIVNLLPIPILDGSHIVLCLVEGVRRKPVDARVQGILQYIGLLILLPFILYITFHDIIRWIRDIIG
jgi:regulator of sigma E protease